MPARLLRRELGVVVSCSADGCTARYQTANIFVRVNRAAAAKVGWVRGSPSAVGGGGRRLDYCPDHAHLEKARLAEHRKAAEERSRARDERRKAARIDPLTLACPTCGAEPHVDCRVVIRGFSFVGGRPPQTTNRTRKPHPQRARGHTETTHSPKEQR